MASDVTAQSVLDKISAGHLECPICSCRFREPKVLDCLHSFCHGCLQRLRECKSPPVSKLKCPLCRKETTLGDVADLPKNFTLSALVEEVTMQEKLLEGQGSKIKCQTCDEENQAVSRCVDCDRFLCQECHKAHDRLMKSHKVNTLAQLRSGEVTYTSKQREEVPRCRKHPDQNLSVYCSTCEQLVCTTCSILDHTKPEHSLIGLPEAFERCKQDVAELAAEVEKNKTEISCAMTETDKSRQKMESVFAETKKKISKKAADEVARIKKEEHKLEQEVERIYKDRVKAFETAEARNRKDVTLAQDKLAEVNQFMAQANCCEILDLKQKLLHNLGELTGKRPEKVPEKLSFIDFEFEEGEELLGKLILENEPELMKPQAKTEESPRSGEMDPAKKWSLWTQIPKFGPKQTKFRRAFDVAAFSNGDIVVTDMGNKQLVTFSVKIKPLSPMNPQGLQIKGLTDPSCVSVNKEDHLILLDRNVVKIFDKKRQLLHKFKPSEGPSGKPTCLAADDSNQIAVGYQDTEEISLHNPDGSLIRTLPAPMIRNYLATGKQRLIYTNCDMKKLLSVDYIGGKVLSADVTSSMFGIWGPTGVCCDRYGNIYVAVTGCPSSEIHRFSPELKHTGCIVEDSSFLSGIALSPGDNHLVVAANNSVSVFHRI